MDNNINEIDTQAKVEARKKAVIMVPKHRFDYLNLCLKQTKQTLSEKVRN